MSQRPVIKISVVGNPTLGIPALRAIQRVSVPLMRNTAVTPSWPVIPSSVLFTMVMVQITWLMVQVTWPMVNGKQLVT